MRGTAARGFPGCYEGLHELVGLGILPVNGRYWMPSSGA
jgi:hypothetical protein